MSSLAQQHRTSQLALRATMLTTLLKLWPTLRAESLDLTFPAWALSVGQLIIARRAMSAGLASQYLTAERFASGVPGAPTIVNAGQADAAQIATSLRVTSLVAVKQSMLAGQPVPQAMANAFVQSSGAATRIALDGGRETVVQSMQVDPAVTHFRRITSAHPCAFCALLASRGAVYLSAESAGENNRYHDHCSCVIAPVYGRHQPTAQERRDRELYDQSTAGAPAGKRLQAFRAAYDKQS